MGNMGRNRPRGPGWRFSFAPRHSISSTTPTLHRSRLRFTRRAAQLCQRARRGFQPKLSRGTSSSVFASCSRRGSGRRGSGSL